MSGKVAPGAIYFALGSPNLATVSVMSAEAGRQVLPDGIEQAVAEVEAYLEKNPGDGRRWELLAPVYLRIGRLDDAVQARRYALKIFGPDAARLGDLGEAVYLASGGVVTPEAKELFLRAEAADGQDVMAQYYLGLSAKQDGRRDEAEKRWRSIIASAPQDAEYLPLIKRALAQIDEKGPIGNAATASEHDGNSVGVLVERLVERLKKDGSDVAGWIQLVRSYRTLGRGDKATAAIADARAALASNPENLQRLDQELQTLAAATGSGTNPSSSALGSAQSGPTAVTAPSQSGPTASDIAAAAGMTPSERNGMIESMVARLAERMAKDGSDVEGWLRLIRAYSVLGQRDKALAAAADARTALAGNSVRRIGKLTKELGLEGS